MLLDNTTRTIQVVLSEAIATTNPTIVGSYFDSGSTPTGGPIIVNANGTTAVTAVSSPASGYIRQVNEMTVSNIDTLAHGVEVLFNDNGTTYRIIAVTLQPGYTLIYSKNGGWQIQSPSGLVANTSGLPYLPLAGGTMTGDLEMDSARIVFSGGFGLYYNSGAGDTAQINLNSGGDTFLDYATGGVFYIRNGYGGDVAGEFDASGNLNLANSLIFPSGGGSDLDYYEEGTWTPVDVSGAGLSFTIAQTPAFVRIGRIVTAYVYLQYPATADVNTAVIGGLPFTCSNYASAPLDTQLTPPVPTIQINSGTTEFLFVAAGATYSNAQMSGASVITALTYLTT